jgi:putative peptidoglycan lipid II flippase
MFSLRAIATVGGMTLISRILGFVREVMIAGILGSGPVAEAFIVAMRLPNLLRQMFAEGAFSAAFVPIFTRHLTEEGKAGARAFAGAALSWLLIILLLMTIAAELAMPWLIHIFAPGFDAYPDKFRAAVLFTGITFPYIIFMSLCALQGGMLNAVHKFGHAAAAPVLLNAILIGTLWFMPGDAFAMGEALSWSVTVAGLVQFLWLAVICQRAGLGLRLPLPRFDPEVLRLGRLMVPGLLGAGVTQINLAVSTILASLHPGSVAYVYYADRLYQLPLALIGSAIGVVLLPALTRALRGDDPAQGLRMQNRALELGLLFSLPATAGLVVAAFPIVVTVYQRGAFTAEDAAAVTLALMIMGSGLPAYVANKALQAGFLAREDTQTPFRYAAISVAVNVAISVVLTPTYGYIGVAIAAMAAAWLNAALLAFGLHRRKYLVIDARLGKFLPRLMLSVILMGAVVWGAIHYLWPGDAAPVWHQVAALVAIIAAGGMSFAAFALLFRATSLSDLRNLRR